VPERRRAVAELSLESLVHNVSVIRGHLAPGTRFCAVVKANAYGHGMSIVAPALADSVDMFAVATSDEALRLRGLLGHRSRILVLGPQTGASALAARHANADIVVADLEAVGHLQEGLRVHLKFDSGMNRAGIRDAVRLRRALVAGGRAIVGLMTHFASADDPNDRLFDDQLNLFETTIEAIQPDRAILVHAANTAATLRSSESHFGMVRCGIGLYGIDPFFGALGDQHLRAVMRVSSYIASIKQARAGDGVGYGHTFRCSHDTQLGLVPIGYGDGLHRAISNRGHVSIEGQRYPIVGNISMDSLVVDLGAGAQLQVGSEVEILGEHMPAATVAAAAQTIPYEVLTHLSERVVRDVSDLPAQGQPQHAQRLPASADRAR